MVYSVVCVGKERIADASIRGSLNFAMINDEMNAFLHEIAEKMKPDFDVNMTNGSTEALNSFAEKLNEVNRTIDWDAIRRSLQMLSIILSSIPNDVKKTQFYQKVKELDKLNLTYEDIEWFIEDIREQVLIENPREESQSELSKYIEQIKLAPNLGIREKVTILLTHIEPLIYETLDYEKVPKDNLRTKVKEITVTKNKGMSPESLAKVYVYGIHSIVFAGTDYFTIPIDKKIPFRNNILHNGVLSYSDDDLQIAYEVLVDFMDALVIMKYWISDTICV